MSRAYSILIARGTAAASTPVVVHTVPAGFRTVIKDIEIQPGGALPSAFYAYVNGSVTLFNLPLTAAAPSNRWQGMVVLNVGDTLTVMGITNAVIYHISGFSLTVP